MARRATAEIALPTESGNRAARVFLRAVGGLLIATVAVVVAMKIENFLITDPRFLLAPPPAYASAAAPFHVSGLFYLSEARVHDVFARDFGRSVYLLPVAQRRLQLLTLDWVEDASVARVWPNRVEVRITERKPVAFAQFDNGGMKLIDAAGVLLEPQRAARLKLPVMTGVREHEARELREKRVTRLLEFQADVGPQLMAKISEVDIRDLGNVRVTMPVDGRLMTLMVGDRDYRRRVDGVLATYPEIARRNPNTTTLDLRVPGRIFAAPSEIRPSESGGTHGRHP